MTAVQQIEVGSIVRFEAPGSRGTSGDTRRIPAIVTGQWPDGSLQLFALHFEGSFLVNAIAPDQVEMVFSRMETDAIFDSVNRRLTDLENEVARQSEGHWKPKPALKFS